MSGIDEEFVYLSINENKVKSLSNQMLDPIKRISDSLNEMRAVVIGAESLKNSKFIRYEISKLEGFVVRVRRDLFFILLAADNEEKDKRCGLFLDSMVVLENGVRGLPPNLGALASDLPWAIINLYKAFYQNIDSIPLRD